MGDRRRKEERKICIYIEREEYNEIERYMERVVIMKSKNMIYNTAYQKSEALTRYSTSYPVRADLTIMHPRFQKSRVMIKKICFL